MRETGPIGILLRPPALLAVLAVEIMWPRLRAVGQAVARWTPVARLHAWVGRLPVFIALPLFLIPEACSRLGWVVSAWLVLRGEPWRALAVYGGSKLIAGSLALWIYFACLPVLLRVRAFAAVHGAAMAARGRAAAWFRQRGGGRLASAMARVRAQREAARNPAAGASRRG